jgi:hypothetical protein
LALAAAAGLALPVLGQGARSRTTTVELAPARAARLPYTAEYKITRVKTLADGTAITHESTEVVAVDSQGRRMTSTTNIPLLGDQTPVTRVSVYDPMAHTNSNWSVPGQKATVTAMPTPGAARPSCATTAPVTAAVITSTARVKPVVEDLGVETVQGIEARGRRTTTTTPAGAIGNNEPLVRTNEVWTAIAPGLRGLVAREVSDDLQTGKMTKELTNLSQSEPDAAIFQVPARYEIVNRDAPGLACPSTEGAETPMAPIPPPPPPPAPEQ